jgi:predicted transcriptional regulator
MPEPMGQMTFRLPDDERERLDREATKQDRKPGELVRMILRMYFEAQDQKGS